MLDSPDNSWLTSLVQPRRNGYGTHVEIFRSGYRNIASCGRNRGMDRTELGSSGTDRAPRVRNSPRPEHWTRISFQRDLLKEGDVFSQKVRQLTFIAKESVVITVGVILFLAACFLEQDKD